MNTRFFFFFRKMSKELVRNPLITELFMQIMLSDVYQIPF